VTSVAKTGGTGVPGETFTLTTGVDTKTANQFDAPSLVTQLGAQVDTLQSTDKLTGAGTNPTLNATLSTNIISAPTLTGIETINVDAQVGARTLDLSKATGLKTLSIDSSQQSLTVRGVANLVDVAVKNSADVNVTEMDTLVQFADSVVSGTADVAKLTLTNNGSANVGSDQFINLRAPLRVVSRPLKSLQMAQTVSLKYCPTRQLPWMLAMLVATPCAPSRCLVTAPCVWIMHSPLPPPLTLRRTRVA